VKKLGLSIVAALLLGSFVVADEKESNEDAASPGIAAWVKASTPLHVQVVFATRVGEKKLSRVPYEFDMITGGPQGASFRVGTEVPIAVSKQVKEGERTDWQYRNVGANIRCTAQALGNGRYLVNLNFEQSSIHVAESKEPGAPAPGVPLFNTWSLISGVMMRDGQTVQSALGSDPNTGETATLEVTIKLMK
jgi:hypothetical protein